MVNNINNYNLQDAIIRQAENIKSSGQTAKNKKQGSGDAFREILNEQISFSKHANLRREERNIAIDSTEMDMLGDACNKAEEKGIRDALIVMNNSAFIVNSKNKTVITVMDRSEMKENIFTNIDGAIFI